MPGLNIDPVSNYRERNATADKALDILLMFADDRLRVTASDVAAHLGVARSTGYRYVQSLVGASFLEEAEGGGFRLGTAVLELARLARRGMGLSEIARPVLQRLAVEVGEAVLLTRLAGSTVICLEREGAGTAPVRISYERGQVLPTNAGASAYVLLAWLPEDDARRVLAGTALEAFTERTLTDVDAILARLAETRERGWALSRAELDVDVLGVAAPVQDGDGRVVAAVSIAAVSSRVPDERLPVLAAAARASAAQISETLGLVG